MKKLLAALLIFLAILVVSCSGKGDQSGITSGKIDYRITYLNDDLDKKTRNILPSRMKLIFDDKQASNNIEGFMGMYKLNAFTNFHTRKCITVLKVLDKHYLFKGKKDEQMCCFDTMDDMVIRKTDETKKIAGFTCRKAIITLPSKNETFTVYYTDEITLKRPNSTNPYHKIDGVLMEFELKLLDLRMRFEAEKFQPLENHDLNPKLKNNSIQVNRTQMTQILNKLME
jgi:GLPGLI family protein